MCKKHITCLISATVISAILAVVGYVYWMESKKDLAIQTLGLRKNAELLFASVPVPNMDVTQPMIASLSATRAPDQRFEKAMRKLRIDDGFPNEASQKRLMIGEKIEVRVVGKDDQFYVHYIGASPKICDGVTFAICS